MADFVSQYCFGILMRPLDLLEGLYGRVSRVLWLTEFEDTSRVGPAAPVLRGA